ncbi:MAG: hypothetical protein WBB27_12260 [Maribacter sp.]|jgi:hypothetical protein
MRFKLNCFEIIVFLIICSTICSCSKTDIDIKFANVTVLQRGIDCGNQFLIELDESPTGIANPFSNIFYEVNLPEEHKEQGLRLEIRFREANSNDYQFPCTTLGLGYPFIYLISSKELEK